MMEAFSSIDSRITRYSNPQELIDATFAQLRKDAVMVNLEVEVDGSMELDLQVEAVSNWLFDIVRNRPNELSGLLYRVDFIHAKAQNILAKFSLKEACDELAIQILRREFAKVMLRRDYS
jgi:hypothetical protein